MARPEDLVPGNCYFLSGFPDEALLFPSISTLRYVRHEQGDDGRDWWLFEEASPSSATEDSDTTPGRPELSVSKMIDIAKFSTSKASSPNCHPSR